MFVIAVRSLSVSLAESYFNPARQHCFAKELAQFSRSLPGTRAPYLHSALFPRVIRAEFFPHGIQLKSVRHGEVYPTGSQIAASATSALATPTPATPETTSMACTDAVTDVNNALHASKDEGAQTLVLQYGAYMN